MCGVEGRGGGKKLCAAAQKTSHSLRAQGGYAHGWGGSTSFAPLRPGLRRGHRSRGAPQERVGRARRPGRRGEAVAALGARQPLREANKKQARAADGRAPLGGDWPHGEHSALPCRATTVAAGENVHKYGTSVTHGVHLIISTAMLYTPSLQAMVNHSESLFTPHPDRPALRTGIDPV